jgi:hypothetical protein
MDSKVARHMPLYASGLHMPVYVSITWYQHPSYMYASEPRQGPSEAVLRASSVMTHHLCPHSYMYTVSSALDSYAAVQRGLAATNTILLHSQAPSLEHTLCNSSHQGYLLKFTILLDSLSINPRP